MAACVHVYDLSRGILTFSSTYAGVDLLVSRTLGLAVVLVLAVSRTFLSVSYPFDLVAVSLTLLMLPWSILSVYPVFAPISENQLCGAVAGGRLWYAASGVSHIAR
jgi:hypothetical protein